MSDNPKLRKNGGQGTRVGNFLRSLKNKIAPSVLEAVGIGDFAKAIGIIKDDPGNAGLTDAELSIVMEYYKLDLQDLADARSLQKDALNQDDIFSKRFIYYLSIGVLTFVFLITIALFFVDVPKDNKTIIDMIIGIIFGGYTSIMAFFFGSSKGSKDKADELKRLQR